MNIEIVKDGEDFEVEVGDLYHLVGNQEVFIRIPDDQGRRAMESPPISTSVYYGVLISEEDARGSIVWHLVEDTEALEMPEAGLQVHHRRS